MCRRTVDSYIGIKEIEEQNILGKANDIILRAFTMQFK